MNRYNSSTVGELTLVARLLAMSLRIASPSRPELIAPAGDGDCALGRQWKTEPMPSISAFVRV